MSVRKIFVVAAVLFLLTSSIVNCLHAQTSRIENHYGILYDLTPLPEEFNASSLIVTVTQLNLELDAEIEGVYVLDSGLGENVARMVRTAAPSQDKDRQKKGQHVLIMSPDLAYHPHDIKEILIHKRLPSFAEKEQARIEEERQKSLTSFFGTDAMNPEEKETIPAKLAKMPVDFIQGIQNLLKSHPQEQTLKGIEIYDYYLSFDQMFPKVETVQSPPSEVYVDKQYFESGQVKQIAYYRGGQLNGTLTMYYENGQRESEWDYVDGALEGMVRLYRENGRLKSEGSYRNGQFLSKKNYDPEGKLIYEENSADKSPAEGLSAGQNQKSKEQ